VLDRIDHERTEEHNRAYMTSLVDLDLARAENAGLADLYRQLSRPVLGRLEFLRVSPMEQ
jgi:hypothetical protein